MTPSRCRSRRAHGACLAFALLATLPVLATAKPVPDPPPLKIPFPIGHKDLDGPIYRRTLDGIYEGQPACFTVFDNAAKARVSGWKFVYQQQLSVLPSPFDGLGLYANFTLVDSAVTLTEPGRVGETLPLFNQSDQLGNLACMERDGAAPNTIVVISSDHGPLLRGKQFLYDNGLRIPLLVRFPDGRGAGTVDDRLASGVDLAPTLLGMAGITPPPGAVHGRDLFAPGVPRPSYVFAARDRMDTSIDRMRAVRTERFKYIRNYLPAVPYMQHNAYKEKSYPTWNLVKELTKAGSIRPPEAELFAAATKPIEELYDLAADPHEVKNLSGEAPHAATLKALRGLVDGFVRDYDRGTAYQDPIDIFRGYNGRLPEEAGLDKSDNS